MPVVVKTPVSPFLLSAHTTLCCFLSIYGIATPEPTTTEEPIDCKVELELVDNEDYYLDGVRAIV